jgi:hypothetical protein
VSRKPCMLRISWTLESTMLTMLMVLLLEKQDARGSKREHGEPAAMIFTR